MSKKNKKKGVALAEALISVAMISIAAIVMGGIIVSAISTTKLSKDYLVAQNLATEAIEAVKNIRSTNRILNPDNPSCWLNFIPSGQCEDATPQVNWHYIASFDGGKWFLEEKFTNPLNLSYGEIKMLPYRLFIESVRVGEASFERFTTDQSAQNTASRFFRTIQFLNYSADVATVEAKVQWLDGTTPRTITRQITLYNF